MLFYSFKSIYNVLVSYKNEGRIQFSSVVRMTYYIANNISLLIFKNNKKCLYEFSIFLSKNGQNYKS